MYYSTTLPYSTRLLYSTRLPYSTSLSYSTRLPYSTSLPYSTNLLSSTSLPDTLARMVKRIKEPRRLLGLTRICAKITQYAIVPQNSAGLEFFCGPCKMQARIIQNAIKFLCGPCLFLCGACGNYQRNHDVAIARFPRAGNRNPQCSHNTTSRHHDITTSRSRDVVMSCSRALAHPEVVMS